MRIVWLPRARDDLLHARDYIAAHHPGGARRVFAAIRAAVRDLGAHPHRGRPRRVDGTREMAVPRTPFLVAYTVVSDRVVIIAVVHGARDWETALG